MGFTLRPFGTPSLFCSSRDHLVQFSLIRHFSIPLEADVVINIPLCVLIDLRMAKITETPIDAEVLGNIQGCASDAASMLGIDANSGEIDLVTAIDEFVFAWQKGDRPEVSADDDLSLTLGGLWGQQLVRKLSWQWASVTFHEHDDASAVGVFSTDRCLAIYPFHFIYGCMENDSPVTIALSFNILLDGSRIPQLPEGSYENVMDNVHHVVPRN